MDAENRVLHVGPGLASQRTGSRRDVIDGTLMRILGLQQTRIQRYDWDWWD